MTIRVVSMYTKVADFAGLVVNTTSKAVGNLETDLSPFFLGPCAMYGGRVARNMENAWQYAKVYDSRVTEKKNLPRHIYMGLPTAEYWAWAEAGWADPNAVRYPMGRGAAPAGSWWLVDGSPKMLGYIQARKTIYAPLYAEAVLKTDGFKWLQQVHESGRDICLRDYDGRDTKDSMTEVQNNPKHKMGHAFVLKMLLTRDPAMKEWTIGDNTPLLKEYLG